MPTQTDDKDARKAEAKRRAKEWKEATLAYKSPSKTKSLDAQSPATAQRSTPKRTTLKSAPANSNARTSPGKGDKAVALARAKDYANKLKKKKGLAVKTTVKEGRKKYVPSVIYSSDDSDDKLSDSESEKSLSVSTDDFETATGRSEVPKTTVEEMRRLSRDAEALSDRMKILVRHHEYS
jgi:hypothetical protein